jgi:hypothetical protein
MQPSVSFGKVTRLRGELFVIGCFQDVRPLKGAAGEVDWLFAGLLSHLFVQKKMTGAKGESALLATLGKIPVQKVLLVGLGEKGTYSLSAFEEVVEGALRQLRGMGTRGVLLELMGVEECGLSAPKALGWLMKTLERDGQKEFNFYIRSGVRARELQQRLRFSPQHIGVE